MFALNAAAEIAVQESGSMSPIAVGITTLVILMSGLFVVVQFGRGREHC